MIHLDDINGKTQVQLPDGRWAPARPLNFQKDYRSVWSRLKDAWAVFRGRADALSWTLRTWRGNEHVRHAASTTSELAHWNFMEAYGNVLGVSATTAPAWYHSNVLDALIELKNRYTGLQEDTSRLLNERTVVAKRVREMEKELELERAASMTLPAPIEFIEVDGTVRRIVFTRGDASVGIQDGWESDDNAWEDLQARVAQGEVDKARMRSEIERLLHDVDCKEIHIGSLKGDMHAIHRICVGELPQGCPVLPESEAARDAVLTMCRDLEDTRQHLAQEGALREEAERIQEFAQLHSSPIEFSESDGTVRRIVFYDREPGFTDAAWRVDDGAWAAQVARKNELLDMVKKLVTGLEWNIENHPEVMNGCDDEALQEAKALIARVRGTQPPNEEE